MAVCTTVTVEGSEPDSSTVEVFNFKANAAAQEAVRVEFDLLNRVESGDGETLEVTVPITINGSQESTATATLGPGENKYIEQTLSAPAGEVEVCVGEVA